MKTLEELRALADERHGDQLYGTHRYVVHLDDVLSVVRQHQLGDAYERAVYGHDLLDDTPTTLQEVVEDFGPTEGDLIYSVSGSGPNRAARREETKRRLQAYPAGIELKGADRISNLRAALSDDNVGLIKMYLGEESEFAPLFALAKPSIQAELQALYDRGRERLARA